MTTTSTRSATDSRIRDDRRRATAPRTTAQSSGPNRPTQAMQRRLVAQLVG